MSQNLDALDVRIAFTWRAAGAIRLDSDGKLDMPRVPLAWGLYRLSWSLPGQARPRVYFGEGDDLSRRMQHYRTPGAGERPQTTNIRVNEEVRAVLAAGGTARVDVATEVTLYAVPGAKGEVLDLSFKSARVFAEHAALETTRLAGDVDLVNSVKQALQATVRTLALT